MADAFVGNWKLDVEQSEFDPKYVPAAGTLVFELDSEGNYLMKAEGITSSGERVAERPQRFVPDGREHSAPDIPGLSMVATCTDPNTISSEGRMNGKAVGQATYTVSADGTRLTATASGMGANGPFKTRAVFIRQ